MVVAFQCFLMLMGGDFNVTLEAKDSLNNADRQDPLLRRFLDIHIGSNITRYKKSGLLVHMEEHEWQYQGLHIESNSLVTKKRQGLYIESSKTVAA